MNTWYYTIPPTTYSPQQAAAWDHGDIVVLDSPSTKFTLVVAGDQWLHDMNIRLGLPGYKAWPVWRSGGMWPNSVAELKFGFMGRTAGVPGVSDPGANRLISLDLWTVWSTVEAKRDAHWPDKCDKCGGPAWIGPVHITCKTACCPERRG